MNRKILRYFLCAVLLPLFLVGCDKDDDDKVPSEVGFLTSKPWTGDAVFYQGQDVTEDFAEIVGYDITKNTMVFKRDGTYTDAYEGEPDLLEGTWEFSTDKESIIFDKDTADEYEVEITKLDATDMYLIYTFEGEEEGETISFEFRYKHP